jgi:mannose-6-phosphate isomerase-like protein (cupin superfamily)
MKVASTEKIGPIHRSPETAPVVQGRREFFTYRDLGTLSADFGSVSAQVHSTRKGLEESTGWHYHTADAQFIYVLKGWVELAFETGETIRLAEGHSCFIPGGAKHNETAMSDDYEVLEVLLAPERMGTVPCEAPGG